jgi:ABC-type Mn2+/Zn2+ transport system ATPase subunit
MTQMTPPKTLLQATDLALGYGRHLVLQRVNLVVHAGEFWVFLGPNGEGKTTLLRAILGLLTPQAGRLWLDPELGRRERLGFVPQRCDLNPTLPTTVREFTLLGLVGVRTSRRERRERLAWALEQVGLAGLAERDYRSLSGGQRQRALVARALVRQPSVLILDEPTNGLDLAAADAFLRCLVDLRRTAPLTILFVTHNVGIAARYATHVALFHAGRVVAGERRAILNAQALARTYGVGIDIASDASGTVAIRVGAADRDR